jgi:hypothetical protein
MTNGRTNPSRLNAGSLILDRLITQVGDFDDTRGARVGGRFPLDLWLSASGFTSLLVAIVYAYVGQRLYSREVPYDARLASAQFTVWWYGLAASAALAGISELLVSAQALTFSLGMTVYLLTVLVDVAFLWGLVGYLAYVYTGRYHLWLICGFYATFYIGLLYYIFVEVPTSFSISAGVIDPHFSHPMAAPIWLEVFVVLALIIPELVGTFAYLSLYLRTTDPTRRFRILFVGVGLLLWFSAELLTPSNSPEWALVRSLIETVAAVLSLTAYVPPRYVRWRFGVRGIDEPAPMVLA